MCLSTFDPIDYSDFDDKPYKSLNSRAKHVTNNNFIILNPEIIKTSEIKIKKSEDNSMIIEQILDFILLYNPKNTNSIKYNNFLSFSKFVGYNLNYGDDDFFYNIK